MEAPIGKEIDSHPNPVLSSYGDLPPPPFALPLRVGFLISSLPYAPQSFVDPGHYHLHSLLEIIDEPGGLNSMLAVEKSTSNLLITKVPTLVIGLHVSHAPGNSDGPSIATVVHSRAWPKISEYRAYVSTKPPEVEMIDSLYKPVRGGDGNVRDAGIMREVLYDFYRSSRKRKPQQIIIFRYGVSESQSTRVLDDEVTQIRMACCSVEDGYVPRLVLIKFIEPEVSESVQSRTTFDYGVSGFVDDFVATGPSRYNVVLNDVGISADELQELVDSLSYVHRLCTYGNSLVAPPLCCGPRSGQLEELKTKRMETKIDLRRAREFICGGEELALYALGHVNAETGGKYKFERFLHGEHGYFWFDFSSVKAWNHVSMYVGESSGGTVSMKIIFAELCYSDGKYESIVHTVLDPKEPEGIKYGCGLCFPGYAGGCRSAHPADPSRYVVGHWPHMVGGSRRFGLIPPN